MNRKTEAPMELPLLEVIAFPADPLPVSVVVAGDFELTGDISISLGASDEQLTELKQIMEFVVNDIADTLYQRAKARRPPFEVTGEGSTEGTLSE